MNKSTTTRIDELKKLPNTFIARTMAEGATKAAKYLQENSNYVGPVLSKKLFVENGLIAYEYYGLLDQRVKVNIIL